MFQTLLPGMLPAVVIAAAWPAFAEPGDAGTPPETVSRVELDLYTGLWHEIARIPNRFQRQCARDTTAHYALRADGRIDVVNRCVTADGSVKEARGIARVVDPASNAKLEVSFVRILGWRLFWGDYWIIDLDPDYRFAVIGHPDRSYGWILSRQPRLDDTTRRRIDAVLKDRGYDPAQFEASPQSRPRP